MITHEELKPIEQANPGGRWWVHNGFLGWAYGSPQDPTPITQACALRILRRTIADRHPDALAQLSRFPAALAYADEGEELYHQTGGNRLIAYLDEAACVFTRKKREPECDYLT